MEPFLCFFRTDTRLQHLILVQIAFDNVAVLKPDMKDGGSCTLGGRIGTRGVSIFQGHVVLDLMPKELQFINLVQGNLLHRTIFTSNMQVSV